MRSDMFVMFVTVWSFLTAQAESRYPLPIMPKSEIAFGAREQDICQDEVKFVFHHGNIKISYEGAASTCLWNIPQLSNTKFSVMVYQMDKVDLSRCNGLLKFPGQGYRCTMKVGDCFIYMMEDNTCDVTDIVQTMREKLQCAETVIRKIPKKDMLSLSFSNNHNNTIKASFEITGSFHDMECASTNNSTSPGNIIHPGSVNTTKGTIHSTNYNFLQPAEGSILDSPRLVGFLMLTTLPVVIAIIGITVYAIRRIRSTPQKKVPSTSHTSEFTHESFITREREVNEYVQPECIIEYELHPRNSFISFPDSEIQSDVAPYTYKNETAIPEKDGYLVPSKGEEGYIAPPDEYTSLKSIVQYVVPPEEEDAEVASVYNDEPFNSIENPYEIVRDVHYRSESYTE